MKHLFLSFCVAVMLIPVFSQEKSGLEDVDAFLFMDIPVVTSTLSEIKLSEAPSNMTVISAAEIEAMGCQTLVDILEKTDGIIVTRNSNGLYLISMRGIASQNNNDKTKLLLNGHTIVELFHNNYTEFYNITADNIKQIEILRGPGSCLYGTNTFGGIINVITKKADSAEGSQISARGGSDDTYRTNYNFSKKMGEDQEFNFNADFSKTEGPDSIIEKDELSNTPFSAAPGEMYEQKEEKRAYADYRYKNFSLMSSYSDSYVACPIGKSYLTQEPAELFVDFWFIEGKYDFKFSEDSILTLKVSEDRIKSLTKGGYFPHGFVLYGDANRDGRLEPMDTDRDGRIEYFPNGGHAEYLYQSREDRTELLWKYKLSDSNQLLLGTFYENMKFYDVTFKADFHPVRLYRVDQYTNFTATGYTYMMETERNIYGGFFQDEWKFSEDYYLLLSGRYDKYNDFGDTFNPRGGLVWNFSEKTKIKLMYSEAFKAPTMNQLYSVTPIIMGNRNLEPEELTSYDLNISTAFTEKLHTSLTLFHTKINNLIEVSQERDLNIAGSPLYYTNYLETTMDGVEMEIRYVFTQSNYLNLGYQYSKGEDKDKDTDYLPFIPENQANAGLNLKLLENLNWNVQIKYIGTRPREKGDPRSDMEACCTTDTTFNYKLIENMLLTFSIYNLFDEETYSPSLAGDYPQSDLPKAGRSFSVGTKVNF